MTEETQDAGTVDFERALRGLAADDREVQVPLHVQAAVMQTWDATMTNVRPPRLMRRPWRLALAAGAAAAAVWSTLIVYRSSHDARPGSVPMAAIEPPRPIVEETPRDPEDRVATRPERVRRERRISRAANVVRAHAGLVLVADPVLDASALSVVRVRMPRSTLARFGIPIADPEASGSVDLEVLVGEDGIARTIRRAVPVTGSDPQE